MFLSPYILLERITTTSTYVRNSYIVETSKRKANGILQLCEKTAPFNDKSGNPYLVRKTGKLNFQLLL